MRGGEIVEHKLKREEIKIFIKADTHQLDIAIKKAKKLKSILKSIKI